MTSTAETLLALRAPGADWLATLITALEESGRDPEFTPQLADVFANLARRYCNEGSLPPAIVEAAHRRTRDFSGRLCADLGESCTSPAEPEERPRLTLVHG